MNYEFTTFTFLTHQASGELSRFAAKSVIQYAIIVRTPTQALSKFMHIHFIGIGGTAMGSVAVACKSMGHHVTGSDHAVYEPMAGVLKSHDIPWHEFSDGNDLVAMPPDLIVVGNAISRGHAELEAVLDARLPITSVSAFVGEHIIARNTSIVCTGTHGKTTTSAIAAWILHHAGFKPGYLIGGVPSGLESGCVPVPSSTHNTRAGVFVVEGDEYDTAFFDKRSKFVHYRPTVAIVNNIEYDHADIFPDIQAILRSFNQLVRIVPRNGLILANGDDENVLAVVHNAPTSVQTVGCSATCSWRIEVLDTQPQSTTWQLAGDKTVGPFTIHMPGLHNVRNASMALLACVHVGVTTSEAALALHDFIPPKRRLESLGVWKGAQVIDDFAHHPTAISATLSAVKQQYPNANIHVVFEPRSNTTTRSIFQHELELCFQGAASVVLGPIHRPERFAPEDRLNTAKIVDSLGDMRIMAYAVPNEAAINDNWGPIAAEWLSRYVGNNDVVLVLSNGNVGGLRQLLFNKPTVAT